MVAVAILSDTPGVRKPGVSLWEEKGIMDDHGSSFSTELEVRVYTRPVGVTGNEWQEAGQGPGIFHFDPGVEVMVRASASTTAPCGSWRRT
jgi:hypothetical protein